MSLFRFIFTYAKSTAFVLGLISALAFAPFFFFPVLIPAFSFLLKMLNEIKSRKTVIGVFFCYGAGLGIASLSWIVNALMIDNGQFFWLIGPALAGLGLFFGLFWAVPAFLSQFALTAVYRWFSFAAAFVLCEWVRSWLFTGFPWNLIGSVWTAYPPVLQFASVFGVYGLSLITLLLFSSPALLPNKKPPAVSLFIFAFITLGGILRLYQAKNEFVFGVRLRLVQPDIVQSLKWDPRKREEIFDTLIHLSRENNDMITHVIWPESAVPYLIEQSPERLRLMSAVRQGGTLITGGLRIVNASKRELANSVFIIDHLADIVGYIDKSHLVPFGEYIPLRAILPFQKIVPIESDFVPGKGVSTHFIPKAPPASVLVCYEIIFPHAVAAKKLRPDWIINVTNDGWYGISAGPYQHLGMAQLRAVEEGLPVARAANTGISAVIDPYGKIINALKLGKKGVVDSSLPRAIAPTLYARFGNMPLLVLLLTGFILASVSRQKKK